MATIRRFEDVEGWQLARQLNREVWNLIASGSFGKDFSLSDQINRSAGSAMDNIAEGFHAGSDAEFVRFLRYSERSAGEVQSQLYRSLDRDHLGESEFQHLYALAEQVKEKVASLIRYLKK